MLRPPRVRPPDRRGRSPKTPTQIREESSSAAGGRLACPSSQAYPYVPWTSIPRVRSVGNPFSPAVRASSCTIERKTPGRGSTRTVASPARVRRAEGYRGSAVLRRGSSDQLAQCRSRASWVSRLRFIGWVQTCPLDRRSIERSPFRDRSLHAVRGGSIALLLLRVQSLISPEASERRLRRDPPTSRVAAWCGHRQRRLVATLPFGDRASP
jgi:hypothetical protein